MPRPKRPAGTLTTRQLEIIRHISYGDEDKLIAQKLGLSPQTVRNHLRGIRSVMGNLNRVQLAVWFIKNKEAI
jgi:DNA-binding CsgD family transcriptional regulator